MKVPKTTVLVSIVLVSVFVYLSSTTGVSINDPNRASTPEATSASLALADDLKQLCQCVERFGRPVPVLDPTVVPIDVSLENNIKCKSVAQCPDPDGCCQPCFDCFGWQLFVSLNWPSKSAGEPDPGKPLGAPGDYSPVVWQTYKNAFDIFGETQPTPWGTSEPLELTLNTAVDPRVFLKADLQSDHNWLTDQDGGVVRYEIRVNRDEFEYIVKNDLWHQAGMRKVVTTGPGIVLPSKKSDFGEVGAIEVKAAWRLIPEARRAYFEQNYKVTHAKVYDHASRSYKDRDVALVGLHIIKKTPNSPQWVWATFEHKDNVPVEGSTGAGRTWNFFNPGAPPTYKPSYKSPPDRSTPRDKPVQAIRVKQTHDDGDAVRINDAMHRLIESKFPKSVWRNYDLISVQWPRQPETPRPDPKLQKALPAGLPVPRVLANTTMETYQQLTSTGGGAGVSPGSAADQGRDTPLPAADKGKSSCIACHRISAVTPFFDPVTRKRWTTDYSTVFYKAVVKK